MSSVTGRIKQIKQPWGGYIRPSSFTIRTINDGKTLNPIENVHSTIIGMAVDYLTRFIMGTPKNEAFKISLQGATIAGYIYAKHSHKIASKFFLKVMGNKLLKVAKKLLSEIKGLDNNSIINACKLVTFDVWYRNLEGAILAKGYYEINPDESTIQNIRIMVERSVSFFKEYGPITKDGFTFENPVTGIENSGYTSIVDAGDGDFLTKDTLWDFKVSKSKLTSRHTLQLLMYWIMGQHSGQVIFKDITKLGIFNPRLNTVQLLEISKVSKETIKEVEDNIICY